ncbi:LOW QUALITY PROTEIN: cation channel sperm-associated auxiliary subunit delta [Ciconia maguari]
MSVALLVGPQGSLGCSHMQLAYSIHFGHDTKPARGTHVSYRGARPMVLQHPCEGHGPGREEPKAAMYLGKDVFISLDAFESSLSPLSIADELGAKEAIVSTIASTIAFVHKDGVLMVDQRPGLCVFQESRTGADPQCKELTWTLFAYNTRHSVSSSYIFLSQDRGYTFTCVETSTREGGVLLRVYSFISFAMTSLLIDRSREDGAGKAAGACFTYNGTKTSHMSNHSSTTFHLLPKGPAKLWRIQNLALRGFIILWTTDTLLVSANNGLIVEEVTLMPLETFQSTAFPDSGFLLVTASSSQIAVLTQDRHLFYSHIGQVTSMVHIAKDDRADLKNTGMLFEERGAFFVPKPGKRSTPSVTASNPHVLAFSAYVLEVGFTHDGNTEYLLHIVLEQQFFSEFADADFCNGVGDGEMSAVTDIPDNLIGYIDVAPLIALVAVSCPPTKHIRTVKIVTAYDKGLVQEAALRNNFGYTISHNIYDSHFLARKHIQQDNLQFKYNFTNLGCPLLVYYKNPWVTIFELWESNRFQKHVPAEFVFEINGMHNYDYLLTAHDANCISQPQNWTSLLEEQESPDPNTARTRRNYMSHKDRNGPELKWPSVKHQVLDGDKNKIIFPSYNGLYVFKASVVDTFYSYCDLSVTFLVYVYGAFPRNYLHFWASLTVCLILLLTFTGYSLSISLKSEKQKLEYCERNF